MKKTNKLIVIMLIIMLILQLFLPLCFAEPKPEDYDDVIDDSTDLSIDMSQQNRIVDIYIKWKNSGDAEQAKKEMLETNTGTQGEEFWRRLLAKDKESNNIFSNNGNTDNGDDKEKNEENENTNQNTGSEYNWLDPSLNAKNIAMQTIVEDLINGSIDAKDAIKEMEKFNYTIGNLSPKDTINLILKAEIQAGNITEEKVKKLFPDYREPKEKLNNYERVEYNSDELTSSVLSWVSGILYYPMKMFINIIRELLEAITSGLAGKSNVTAEDVLFNDVGLINVNFFRDINTGYAAKFATSVRAEIAKWYYIMRTTALVVSIAILVYIAIRMATSTASSEKQGEYKKMFSNWVKSFAIVFVMHYIMMLVLYGNDALVNMVKGQMNSNGALSTYLDNMRSFSLLPEKLSYETFGADIVALMLAGLTLAFLLMYMKRFIIVMFLAIISPLITIMYAIDKIADGRAQTLEVWFNKFLWTVLIQPFHCVIYMMFVSISIDVLANHADSFASCALAIYSMIFVLQAENIIKTIFGIKTEGIKGIGEGTAFVAGATMASMSRSANLLNAVNSRIPNKNRPKTKDTTSLLRDKKSNNEKDGKNQNTKENEKNGADLSKEGSSGNAENTERKLNPQQKNEENTDVAHTPRTNKKMNKFLETVGKTGKVSGKVIKTYAKMAGAISGGALSLLTDNADVLSAGITGWKGMGALTDGTLGLGSSIAEITGMKKAVRKARLNNRINDAYNAYATYKRLNPYKTEEEIEEEAEKYLAEDFDTNSLKHQDEKDFAESLRKVAECYKNLNYANYNEEALNVLGLNSNINNTNNKR